MATTARLDLSVWRNDDVYEYPLQIRGLDLSPLALRMQVRLAPDTPGPALIDLGKVNNGNAQGLRVAGVNVIDGIPVTDLRIRVNKSTLQGMPYAGELGSSTPLAYALQISGKTRLVGYLSLLAHTIDSDAAPAARPFGSFQTTVAGIPSGGAAVTIAGVETTVVGIDGPELVAPILLQAQDAAGAAVSAAGVSSGRASDAQASAEQASLSAAAALASGPFPSVAAGLAATAEGGGFLVQGAGEIYAALYRKVSGAAQAQNLQMPSLAGVQASSTLASYVADARVVLRRAFDRQLLPMQRETRDLAVLTVIGAKVMTTDGSAINVYAPDASNSYGAAWTRDQSMAMAAVPELFPSNEIAAIYGWIKQRCRTVTWQGAASIEVPDHVAFNGTAYYRPGGDDNDPNAGKRAPVDGNFMLLQMAWVHYVKVGKPTLYATERDFLWDLLEKVPYDPGTKCVAVPTDPTQFYLPWGFMDTVRVSGSVCFATVLAFQAYRQLADMAFAAEDYPRARQAMDRAEEIRAGFQATLWALTSNSTSYRGWFRTATGTCSGQFDIWGSALACYVDLATPEQQRGISLGLADAWGKITNTFPELYYRGGVRHVLRSNDYQTGTKIFEGSVYSLWDLYQNGGYWNTPVPWVIYALGITSPQIASKLAMSAVSEAAYEQWAYLPTSNPSPMEWVGVGGSTGNIADDFQGAANYVTSATAILSIAAADCGALDGMQSMSGPDPSTYGSFSYPQGNWTNLPFDITLTNELMAHNAAGVNSNFIAPYSGRYRLAAVMRFAPQTGAPGAILIHATVNGQRVAPMVDQVSDGSSSFSLIGSAYVDVKKGDQISAQLLSSNVALVPQVPGALDPSPVVYSSLTLSFVSAIPFAFG